MTERELGNLAISAVFASVAFSNAASEFVFAPTRNKLDDNTREIMIPMMNEKIAAMQALVDGLMDQVYGK